jgi:cobalt-zinc-cadmium efflux system outer membrane protein
MFMHAVPVFRCCAAAVIAGVLWPGAADAQTAAPVARLTMDEAVRLAIARNQTLEAQRLGIDASKADEVTAGLKPNPSLSFSVSGFPVFSPNQFNADYIKNTLTYDVGASYLFERGGKRDNRVLVAQNTTNVAAKGTVDAERQLRFQTAQAFINVLLAKSTLDLAQQDLQNFSQVVDVNKQRVTAGDLAEGDFFKISLQKLQFEQDVSSAQVGLVQARAALRQVVGFDTVTDDFDVIGELTHAQQTANLDELKQQALAARPDLQVALGNLTLAQNTLSLQKSNAKRDITGGVDYLRNDVGNFSTLNFGVSIDLPIHDRNQGNIAKSEVQIRQAQESQQAARYQVLTDVTSAYGGWQSADQVVKIYESGYLDQAKQSLDISQYVFQRGAGSLLDLLDAERTYRDTQLGYRQALAAYMTSVAQLNQAVGRQVMP